MKINSLSCDTHLDEAREESGFLDPISNMEKLQDGEQLAQTHHKANRVKCVCYSICKVKNHIFSYNMCYLVEV